MIPVNETLVGDSACMVRLRAQIERAARSPVPVLIEGPTGSGKELVAIALHRLSQRTGKLVPVNVCAIAETMFEDALFGHVRGAFTGAVSSSRGFALEADRGSLFLDEISSLALPSQAKLLRMIESKRFRPIGGREDLQSDFRLIVASNTSLADETREGRFREDLFHRVSALSLQVPPLRARRGDVPILCEHFALRFAEHGGRFAEFAPAALEALQRYDWPGNVRELRSVIEVAITMADDLVISSADIEAQLCLRQGHRTQVAKSMAAREEMARLLATHAGDTREVAGALGVNRATVYRRLRELAIPTPKNRRSTGIASA
ncbi:MAG: sigma 54-interacting transcriptional regulator [Gemmatimonadaceae bacterium]